MKYMVSIFPADDADPALLEAANIETGELVWGMYCGGLVREMYMRDDERGTVFIAEASDVSVIRDALAATPLVQKGLVTGEVVGLLPFAPIRSTASSAA